MPQEDIDMPEDTKIIETTELEVPKGKTFSEDYVKSIREEARDSRLARKSAEAEVLAVKAKFKALLGLKPEEEFDDAKITAYQTAQNQKLADTLTKANERLLLAEIKSLEGYDYKLVLRLLDKSQVTINEDGIATGLKEAVEALAIEFPTIKKSISGSGAANPPAEGTLTEIEQLETDYLIAIKSNRTAEAISLKNKIFALQNKK